MNFSYTVFEKAIKLYTFNLIWKLIWIMWFYKVSIICNKSLLFEIYYSKFFFPVDEEIRNLCVLRMISLQLLCFMERNFIKRKLYSNNILLVKLSNPIEPCLWKSYPFNQKIPRHNIINLHFFQFQKVFLFYSRNSLLIKNRRRSW